MKLLLLVLITLLSACVQPPPAAPHMGLMDVSERPAEKALLEGIRAYEDANYALAETQLLLAIRTGLASPKDNAAGEKYLAFIYCSSNRFRQCESSFRSALNADPSFSLSKSEAGHPLWGSVFERIAKP